MLFTPAASRSLLLPAWCWPVGPRESSGRLLAPPAGMHPESTPLTRSESEPCSDSFAAVDHLCNGASNWKLGSSWGLLPKLSAV